MIIGKYKISSTTASGSYDSFVRVRRNNVLIVEIKMGRIRNPWRYIKNHLGTKREEFINKMLDCGIEKSEIFEILEETLK